MTHKTRPVSPLRQRMIGGMALRKLAPKTQSNYLRAVINLWVANSCSRGYRNLSVRKKDCASFVLT